jgi:hypothetical protein
MGLLEDARSIAHFFMRSLHFVLDQAWLSWLPYIRRESGPWNSRRLHTTFRLCSVAHVHIKPAHAPCKVPKYVSIF